jgi:hypothetical protein
MSTKVECEEYLDEVREQVCDQCPTQGCWDCVVKQQLGRLVEAIHDADAMLDPAVFAHLVRAVHSVDERHVQWEVVRRHVDHTPRRRQRVPVAAMIQAYEATTGTCIGCD